jgi:hypothetical protein
MPFLFKAKAAAHKNKRPLAHRFHVFLRDVIFGCQNDGGFTDTAANLMTVSEAYFAPDVLF